LTLKMYDLVSIYKDTPVGYSVSKSKHIA
jgi:hypothetical protein